MLRKSYSERVEEGFGFFFFLKKTVLKLDKDKNCRKMMFKSEDNSKNIEKTILNIQR